jgi:hypothetical protein
MLINPSTHIEKESVFVDRGNCIKNFKEYSQNLEFWEYIVLFSLQKQDYFLIKEDELLNKTSYVLDNSGKLSLVWEFLNSVLDNLKKWYYLYPLDPS